MLKVIPAEYHDKSKGTLKLLWEEEWRAMGITQVGSEKTNRCTPKERMLTDCLIHRAWVGNTMKSTSQSRIFFFSSKLMGLVSVRQHDTI